MITFASTGKGEGKTFIATHFAQAFAAMDKKVLVLDMNIKNPAVASHFDTPHFWHSVRQLILLQLRAVTPVL